MPAQYKNVIRSKNLIKGALTSLLKQKKDFMSITVTDIVREADINRGTFYNHYSGVGDVLNEIEADMMTKLTESLNKAKKDPDPVNSFINVVSVYLTENDETYKSIIKSIPKFIFDDLKEKMIKGIKSTIFPLKGIVPNKKTEVAIHLLSNSLSGTYVDYLMGTLQVPLNDLIKYSAELCTDFVNSKKQIS